MNDQERYTKLTSYLSPDLLDSIEGQMEKSYIDGKLFKRLRFCLSQYRLETAHYDDEDVEDRFEEMNEALSKLMASFERHWPYDPKSDRHIMHSENWGPLETDPSTHYLFDLFIDQYDTFDLVAEHLLLENPTRDTSVKILSKGEGSHIANLSFDPATGILRVNRKTVKFQKRGAPYKVLKVLDKNLGHIFTYQQIIDELDKDKKNEISGRRELSYVIRQIRGRLKKEGIRKDVFLSNNGYGLII